MLSFSGIEPDVIAVDQHPDLASGLFARDTFATKEHVRVQHHHAHMAAVMLENGLRPEARVAAVILDGHGYSDDETIWGGEVLVGGYDLCQRIGHLRPIPQPGGDAAAREPGRMATSLLWDGGIDGSVSSAHREAVAELCGRTSISPLTSSAGRLFDGVAALLGVAPAVQEYEGEAAGLLEAIADPTRDDAYPLPSDGTTLDTRVLVAALVEDRSDIPTRAARFQNGLADGLVEMVADTAERRVVLGGGCMVNRILLRRLVAGLEREGREVLRSQRLPPGDGSISAGQAAVAASMIGG
jgi:hydrogenase maturation protein HypF